jgi:hypothetical protein
VCGIDEMGATDKHWFTGPGCSFVGTPKPRDRECSIVGSPRCVYDHLHCLSLATIDTSTIRKPLGHQLKSHWESFRRSTESVHAWSTVQTRFAVSHCPMQTLAEISTAHFGRPMLQYSILNLPGCLQGSLIDGKVACVDVLGSCVPWPIINS